MKFCKDCKHYRNNWRTLWSPYCARNSRRYTDTITGRVTFDTNLVGCAIERLLFKTDSECYWLATGMPEELKKDFCGKDAQFWEPKE